MGSNPTASAKLHRAAVLTAALFVSACATIPGESTAPRAVQREVSDRVLALARTAEPQCRQHKVATTELLDVYSDGRSSQELWIVEACGRRLNYVVTFPPKRGTGTSHGFTVRPER